MKILVTGGGGFVGRNVAAGLRQMNHEVLAPTHKELDMTDLSKCMCYLNSSKVDAIVHTAFKGHFASTNQHQDFVDNIRMFEVLTWMDNYRPTIIIASGAEFDRRFPIDQVEEDEVFKRWPVDLYGLSKNIITRRALSPIRDSEDEQEIHDPFVLRLFGCFGSDEPDFRFIKRSITRLKEGLPIEIQKNKEMDFFFVDDVAIVINKVLKTRSDTFRHVNLVYEQVGQKRYTLADVGEIICEEMGVPAKIVVKEKELDHPYTGNGYKLERETGFLFGIRDGIKRMVNELE